MCRKIVGIDGLQRLKLLPGLIITVPLIVRDPQFPPWVARLRILLHHALQIGQLALLMMTESAPAPLARRALALAAAPGVGG